MNQLPFIIGSYAATTVIIGSLVLATLWDARHQRRKLARLEALDRTNPDGPR
jgi:heme exporter protein CcmD